LGIPIESQLCCAVHVLYTSKEYFEELLYSPNSNPHGEGNKGVTLLKNKNLSKCGFQIYNLTSERIKKFALEID
jgi:hypothetical protein